MTREVQTDAELFAAGRRARSLADCQAVIVATGTGEHGEISGRNYHQCLQGKADHNEHYCGCGQTWKQVGGRFHTEGPLRDVVM